MTYATLREKIAAESAGRRERYAKFEAAYNKAVAAGKAAGEAKAPVPMVVAEHADPLNDRSPVNRAWHCAEGACGFAWVRVRPGNCSFAKWLVKNGHARPAYEGGVDIWISAFNQSVERKEACARAMAEVFRSELGVNAYSDSRLD
jgi:hypothetical protein